MLELVVGGVVDDGETEDAEEGGDQADDVQVEVGRVCLQLRGGNNGNNYYRQLDDYCWGEDKTRKIGSVLNISYTVKTGVLK